MKLTQKHKDRIRNVYLPIGGWMIIIGGTFFIALF